MFFGKFVVNVLLSETNVLTGASVVAMQQARPREQLLAFRCIKSCISSCIK
jgi:hypothetical protein